DPWVYHWDDSSNAFEAQPGVSEFGPDILTDNVTLLFEVRPYHKTVTRGWTSTFRRSDIDLYTLYRYLDTTMQAQGYSIDEVKIRGTGTSLFPKEFDTLDRPIDADLDCDEDMSSNALLLSRMSPEDIPNPYRCDWTRRNTGVAADRKAPFRSGEHPDATKRVHCHFMLYVTPLPSLTGQDSGCGWTSSWGVRKEERERERERERQGAEGGGEEDGEGETVLASMDLGVSLRVSKRDSATRPRGMPSMSSMSSRAGGGSGKGTAPADTPQPRASVDVTDLVRLAQMLHTHME
ncbi:hypothetical protein KIPB_010208, partial [Kipferlia bialata]